MATNQHRPEFIAEMKEQLLAEKEKLQQGLRLSAVNRNGDFQAKYPEYGEHEDENATEIADFVANQATTEALESRLEEVQAALERIEKGTYGLSPDGSVIPENRLRANPAATTSVK